MIEKKRKDNFKRGVAFSIMFLLLTGTIVPIGSTYQPYVQQSVDVTNQ